MRRIVQWFRCRATVTALRKLHTPKPVGSYRFVCRAEGHTWPCETARVIRGR